MPRKRKVVEKPQPNPEPKKVNVSTLVKAKQELKVLLRRVEVEIKQTDVEWLNLAYVAENLSQPTDQPSTSKMPPPQVVEINFKNAKQGDLPVLNLNPAVPSLFRPRVTSEEFDSDSD